MSTITKLTPYQKKVLEKAHRWLEEHGQPPNLVQLARALHRTVSATTTQVYRLREKGLDVPCAGRRPKRVPRGPVTEVET